MELSMKHVLFIMALFLALGARAQDTSLNVYTGKYNFTEGSQVTEGLVELKDNKLVISSEKGAASLTRIESDSFSVDEYGGYVAFRRSATKLISGLKVSIPAASIDIEGVKIDSAAAPTPAKLTVNTQRAPFVRKGSGLDLSNMLVVFINQLTFNIFDMPYDIVRHTKVA